MHLKSLIIVGLVVVTSVPAIVQAQQQPAQSTDDRELQVLSSQTAEAVVLLRQLVNQQIEEMKLKRAQVAVLALQLRSTAISDIEARIHSLEDRAEETREITAQYEAEVERIEATAQKDSIKEQGRRQLEAKKTQVETQIERAKQRLWSLERQILDLRNALNSKQRDIEGLEEIVMEVLGDL